MFVTELSSFDSVIPNTAGFMRLAISLISSTPTLRTFFLAKVAETETWVLRLFKYKHVCVVL